METDRETEKGVTEGGNIEKLERGRRKDAVEGEKQRQRRSFKAFRALNVHKIRKMTLEREDVRTSAPNRLREGRQEGTDRGGRGLLLKYTDPADLTTT